MSTTELSLSGNKTIPLDQLGVSTAEQSAQLSKLLKNEFGINVKPNIKNPFTGDAQISVRDKNVTVKGVCNGGNNLLKMRCIDHIHPLDGLALGVQKASSAKK